VHRCSLLLRCCTQRGQHGLCVCLSVCLSVCVCLCVLDTLMSCAETTELIEMPLGAQTQVGQRNVELGGKEQFWGRVDITDHYNECILHYLLLNMPAKFMQWTNDSLLWGVTRRWCGLLPNYDEPCWAVDSVN